MPEMPEMACVPHRIGEIEGCLSCRCACNDSCTRPTLAACKTLAKAQLPEIDWFLSQIAALIAYRSARAATYTLTQLTNNLPSRAPAAAP